jgi:hypothetical protein
MKALTANRLTDGAVIYLTSTGDWSRIISDLHAFPDTEGEAALAQALAQPTVFVGPYLIDVDDTGPVGRERLKETIRSSGPTVGHSLKGAA